MNESYNKKVEELCSDIPLTTPDWGTIFGLIKPNTMYSKERPYDIGTLVGLIAEHHVRNCLQNKCQNNDFSFPVTLGDPLVKPPKRGRFRYVIKDDGSIEFYERIDKKTVRYCQFDYSANIDGIPAIFEVSVGKYSNKGRKRIRRKDRKNSGLAGRLRENERERLLLPLIKSFDNQFTFTMVVTRDTYSKLSYQGSKLLKFVKRGGIVIPIYADREQLREDVIGECEKRDVHFKNNLVINTNQNILAV